MILSLVSEILSRVARNPEIDQALDTLRRSKGEVHLSGLTDPAKAFVSAVAPAQLGRPTVLIAESNQRAEMLLEPARWFYRAVSGKPGRRVAHLPAYDVLPYESRSPHAEISEDRAVALWRFALSEADLLIVPVQAAVWRLREPEFYGELALTIARDQSIEHQALLNFLSSAGYDKQVTCEMPGQFAVRGGIIDIFSPEASQPVRVELLGDTIESIRAFDPNTQRSTNPVERAMLMPLTEFPRDSEVLERLRVRSSPDREDDSPLAAFFPGWEFKEVLREERKSTVFDLGPDPLVLLDEPSLIADCLKKIANSCKGRSMSLTIRWPNRPALICGTMKNGCTRYNGSLGWRSSILPSRTKTILRTNTCFARSPPRAITATLPHSWPKFAGELALASKSLFPAPAPANWNGSPIFATSLKFPIAWVSWKRTQPWRGLRKKDLALPGRRWC